MNKDMNRYGLTDRELHKRWLACGSCGCTQAMHHGCPYFSPTTNCEERLDRRLKEREV